MHLNSNLFIIEIQWPMRGVMALWSVVSRSIFHGTGFLGVFWRRCCLCGCTMIYFFLVVMLCISSSFRLIDCGRYSPTVFSQS